MASRQHIGRYAVACLLCLGYPILAYLSLDPTVSLSPAVIGGYIVITALALRDLESVTDLIAAWRTGGSGSGGKGGS